MSSLVNKSVTSPNTKKSLFWQLMLAGLCLASFSVAEAAGNAVNGKALYNNTNGASQSCGNAGCHGSNPASGLNKIARATNAITTMNAISGNKGNMGILGNYLTTAEAEDIAAYIVSPAAAEIPATPAFTVDTTTSTGGPLNGLFYNSPAESEAGWGVSLTQRGPIIFVAWFTYDAAKQPTWYVASNCAVSNNGCSGDLYKITNGENPLIPWTGSIKIENFQAPPTFTGSISFAFTDNDNGTMTFTINGVSGSKTITRQTF